MKKLLTVKSLIVVAVIVWIGLSVRSVLHIRDYYKPQETTEKIWVSEKCSIVNQIDEHYMPIWDVHLSGTAVYVPFQNFKENFAGKNSDVIIQTDGLVYYIAEQAGRKFFAKVNYTPYKGVRSHSYEVMISDLTVKNFYGWGWSDITFESIIMLIVWGVAIGVLCFIFYRIYFLVNKKIESIRTNPA